MPLPEVRRPPFDIDETVPFQWQPANPAFGLFGNAFTFIAIAFERYVVAVTREAMGRITDPDVLAEADVFLRQEAQHARAHRHHAKAMVANYPGLADVMTRVNEAYDELLATEDLEFHLAYVANLEATFTPLFKMVFDNRGPLFEGGDERVGTLLLWHFVEEIEHRSSALIVHHAVTPDRRYRRRQVRKVFGHTSKLFSIILQGIEEHVPLEDRMISTDWLGRKGMWTGEITSRFRLLRRWKPDTPTMLAHVPGADLRRMVWRFIQSQRPNHDPAREPLPRWVNQWHAAFDAGEDVTTYAGARL
jgi:predicted metal-dependent hydrolase